MFDLKAAELRKCTLFRTASVEYAFEKTNNPYCILKFFPELASSLGLETSSVEAAQPHFMTIRYLSLDDDEARPTVEQGEDSGAQGRSDQ